MTNSSNLLILTAIAWRTLLRRAASKSAKSWSAIPTKNLSAANLMRSCAKTLMLTSTSLTLQRLLFKKDNRHNRRAHLLNQCNMSSSNSLLLCSRLIGPSSIRFRYSHTNSIRHHSKNRAVVPFPVSITPKISSRSLGCLTACSRLCSSIKFRRLWCPNGPSASDSCRISWSTERLLVHWRIRARLASIL